MKNYRQQTFTAEGKAALHQELSQLIADDQVRRDFIQMCLTHLIYVQYDEVQDL